MRGRRTGASVGGPGRNCPERNQPPSSRLLGRTRRKTRMRFGLGSRSSDIAGRPKGWARRLQVRGETGATVSVPWVWVGRGRPGQADGAFCHFVGPAIHGLADVPSGQQTVLSRGQGTVGLDPVGQSLPPPSAHARISGPLPSISPAWTPGAGGRSSEGDVARRAHPFDTTSGRWEGWGAVERRQGWGEDGLEAARGLRWGTSARL